MERPAFTFHCTTPQCGKAFQADLQDIGRTIYCPQCGRIVEIQPPLRVGGTPRYVRLWRHVLAWISHASRPTGAVPPAFPSPPSPEIVPLLHELGQRAWRKETRHPSGSFLLAPRMLSHRTDATALAANLGVLYEHARRWAPGLRVPYQVPRVRLSEALPHPGQYHVDSEGWVTIDVSAAFASKAPMLAVILAHEACHHILDLTGLDDKRDRARTERMTDLAMFICGFGDIVTSGRIRIQQTASGYVHDHLGYLAPSEYDYAYAWVLGARVANGLPGMGSQGAHAAMITGFHLPDPVERLKRELASRIPDVRGRERVIQYYHIRYPDEMEEQILQRILEDYARDNR